MWDNDDQLFALMRTRLFPAVVGDILDSMGLLKAAGAVLDGYSSDTPEVLESGLPVFSYGGYAQDQIGRAHV